MKQLLSIFIAAFLLSCAKTQQITAATHEWVKNFLQAHPGSRPESLIPFGSDASTQEYEFTYYPPNSTTAQKVALTFKKKNETWYLERELPNAK